MNFEFTPREGKFGAEFICDIPFELKDKAKELCMNNKGARFGFDKEAPKPGKAGKTGAWVANPQMLEALQAWNPEAATSTSTLSIGPRKTPEPVNAIRPDAVCRVAVIAAPIGQPTDPDARIARAIKDLRYLLEQRGAEMDTVEALGYLACISLACKTLQPVE